MCFDDCPAGLLDCGGLEADRAGEVGGVVGERRGAGGERLASGLTAPGGVIANLPRVCTPCIQRYTRCNRGEGGGGEACVAALTADDLRDVPVLPAAASSCQPGRKQMRATLVPCMIIYASVVIICADGRTSSED